MLASSVWQWITIIFTKMRQWPEPCVYTCTTVPVCLFVRLPILCLFVLLFVCLSVSMAFIYEPASLSVLFRLFSSACQSVLPFVPFFFMTVNLTVHFRRLLFYLPAFQSPCWSVCHLSTSLSLIHFLICWSILDNCTHCGSFLFVLFLYLLLLLCTSWRRNFPQWDE